MEREIEKQEQVIVQIDEQIEKSGDDYQKLTELLKEKEQAELLLSDLMDQWAEAQE